MTIKKSISQPTSSHGPTGDASVVVPALNEADNIGQTVATMKHYFDSVIVVDDGSIDETSNIAVQHGAIVLKHAANQGLGVAIATGVDHALRAGASAIATADGDGAHNSVRYDKMLALHLSTNADLTLGSRFLPGVHQSYIPDTKIFANLIVSQTLNHMTSSSISDWLTGARIFSKRLASQKLGEIGFAVSVNIVLLAIRNRLSIREHPISAMYPPRVLNHLKRTELVSFLKFVQRMAPEKDEFSFALSLAQSGSSMLIKAFGEQFFLHWLSDYDGYLVQSTAPRESAPFINQSSDNTQLFVKAIN